MGSGTKPASEFLANPNNWRIHPKPQQDALGGVLSEVGWVQQVVENARTGNLIDGHLRVSLALSQGDDTPVPYVAVDLSEEEERLVIATIDPLGAMAATDAAKLDELLRDIQTTEPALQAMLSKLAADEGLTKFDPSAEWQGMPEFEHEDQTAEAAFIIRVFLKDADDLAAFGRLLGKDLTGRKFTWFSKQPQGETYEAYDGPQS